MNESTLVPREEMSDLDWLARNVHVWVEDWTHVRKCQVRHEARWMASLSPNAEYKDWRTKAQWLSRRSELQNKPSWNDAPEWAVYMAQSPNGHWEFFSAKPIAYNWWRHPLGVKSKANGASKTGLILGDWRDTLEKRPDMYKNKEEIDTSSECVHKTEESVHISELEMLAKVSHLISDKRHRNQFEPFVSVEDAKLTIMQSDGDVKHFGGIIGRSLPLEEDAATAKQPTPKGSGNPILGMVLADLTNRALEGKERYGEPLLAHNGRNPLWDAYQEALDLAMYLRQAIEEQK